MKKHLVIFMCTIFLNSLVIAAAEDQSEKKLSPLTPHLNPVHVSEELTIWSSFLQAKDFLTK